MAYDWQAEQRQRTIDSFDRATRDHTGVWRWKSNERCVPGDVMTVWLLAHLVATDDVVATAHQRRRDDEAFLAEYRRRQPAEPSWEERAEARAAFGEGVELVDVLTNRRWTT